MFTNSQNASDAIHAQKRKMTATYRNYLPSPDKKNLLTIKILHIIYQEVTMADKNTRLALLDIYGNTQSRQNHLNAIMLNDPIAKTEVNEKIIFSAINQYHQILLEIKQIEDQEEKEKTNKLNELKKLAENLDILIIKIKAALQKSSNMLEEEAQALQKEFNETFAAYNNFSYQHHETFDDKIKNEIERKQLNYIDIKKNLFEQLTAKIKADAPLRDEPAFDPQQIEIAELSAAAPEEQFINTIADESLHSANFKIKSLATVDIQHSEINSSQATETATNVENATLGEQQDEKSNPIDHSEEPVKKKPARSFIQAIYDVFTSPKNAKQGFLFGATIGGVFAVPTLGLSLLVGSVIGALVYRNKNNEKKNKENEALVDLSDVEETILPDSGVTQVGSTRQLLEKFQPQHIHAISSDKNKGNQQLSDEEVSKILALNDQLIQETDELLKQDGNDIGVKQDETQRNKYSI